MFSNSSFSALVALSLLAAACQSPKADPSGAGAAVLKPVMTVAKPPEVAPAPSPVVTIAAAVATPPAAPAVKSTSTASGLTVKRFVVASGIDNREPNEIENVELGEQPTFAFVELANAGEADQIVITFEREGSSETVGHVELDVPAAMQRWRTWGKTQLIQQPGRWSAVLRDKSGKELARKSFDVVRLTSEGDGRIPLG